MDMLSVDKGNVILKFFNKIGACQDWCVNFFNNF